MVVGVGGVDEVVEDEPRAAAPSAGGQRSRTGSPSQPAGRQRVEAVVGQHDVGQVAGAVARQGVEVVGEVEAAGLARLGGDVAGEHDERPGGGDRLADARHEQRREDAGEQAARAR